MSDVASNLTSCDRGKLFATSSPSRKKTRGAIRRIPRITQTNTDTAPTCAQIQRRFLNKPTAIMETLRTKPISIVDVAMVSNPVEFFERIWDRNSPLIIRNAYRLSENSRLGRLHNVKTVKYHENAIALPAILQDMENHQQPDSAGSQRASSHARLWSGRDRMRFAL